MREYVPRFETVFEAPGKECLATVVADLYYNWARIHLARSIYDGLDEHLWRDWEEAERVARKAIAHEDAAGRASKATEGHLLENYEMTLGRILCYRSKYTDAAQVLSGAFARLKNKKGCEDSLKESAVLLGHALLKSGRAAETETHCLECVQKPGRKGHPTMGIIPATYLTDIAFRYLFEACECLLVRSVGRVRGWKASSRKSTC